MAIGIYKITNKVNGKIYIGQSRNITNRWEVHKTKARLSPGSQGAATYLANAMRKHGIDNFYYEVIEKCKIKELDEKERYWIEHFNSCNHEIGYNQTSGGTHKPPQSRLNQEQVNEIYELLTRRDITLKQIGALYGVSEDSISFINCGHRWVQEGRVYPVRAKAVRFNPKRPDRESLIKTLEEIGFNQAAIHYDVSLNTLKRWCSSEGIPNPQKKFNAWIDSYNKAN